LKKTKKVSAAAKLFLIAFSIYAAFTIVSLQMQIRSKQNEMAELQQQIDAQKLENSEISDVLKGGDETEYIAQIARERLGYIMPGQRVFVDISGK
jgi:cell division protein FtsB